MANLTWTMSLTRQRPRHICYSAHEVKQETTERYILGILDLISLHPDVDYRSGYIGASARQSLDSSATRKWAVQRCLKPVVGTVMSRRNQRSTVRRSGCASCGTGVNDAR